MAPKIPNLKQQRGFSLVELLVVVAIIIVLLALLLPSIRNLKQKALETQCMANMRSLQGAHTTYSTDNSGVMPGSRTGASGRPGDWVNYSGSTDDDKRKNDIEIGSLWKYLKDYAVYQCPRFPRELNHNGNIVGDYVRHYSLNDYLNGSPNNANTGINGWAYPAKKSVSGVPKPAETLSFIEEPDPRKGLNGSWVTEGRPGKNKKDGWVDPIGFWHSAGAVFAFLDGHVERKQWNDSRTLAIGFSFFAVTPNNPDLQWIKNHSCPGDPLAPQFWND